MRWPEAPFRSLYMTVEKKEKKEMEEKKGTLSGWLISLFSLISFFSAQNRANVKRRSR